MGETGMAKSNKQAKKPKKDAGAKVKAGAATGFTPAATLAGKGKPKKA
jgi:hypothetical protein